MNKSYAELRDNFDNRYQQDFIVMCTKSDIVRGNYSNDSLWIKISKEAIADLGMRKYRGSKNRDFRLILLYLDKYS